MSAEQLPALIDRATRCLAEARTSAEVLEAKAAAEAALHYARVTKAANEAQADCLRMIVRAEMRMADEIDRGQERGEVARQGQRSNVRAPDVCELDDLGIDRRRVAEWRAIRDAGPALVEKVINQALAEERAPTKADIHRAINRHRSAHPPGSGSLEFYTPESFLVRARQTLGGVDCDPASSVAAQRVVRASKYHTAQDDGLCSEWHGRVWLNPPYREAGAWSDKLLEELSIGRTTAAILLVNAYTETRWFHRAANACSAICFPSDRVYFLRPDEDQLTKSAYGSALIYFGDDTDGFRLAFSDTGVVLVPARGEP
jgi:hypothetical protein